MDQTAATTHATNSGMPYISVIQTVGRPVGHFNGRQVQAQSGPAGSRVTGSDQSVTDHRAAGVAEERADYLRNARPAPAQPQVRDCYQAAWRRFATWGTNNGLSYWPASPETVEAYVKEMALHASPRKIKFDRSAIGATHRDAGFENPCLSKLVCATIKQLPSSTRTSEPLRRLASTSQRSSDREDFAAIRNAAIKRQRRGAPDRRPNLDVMRRTRVDAALCSVTLGAGLGFAEAAALEWRDLNNTGEGRKTITVRAGKSEPNRNVEISEQAYADLRALAYSEQPQGRVFALDQQQVGDRVRAAARAAGFSLNITGRRVAGDPPAPFRPAREDTVPLETRHWQAFARWCDQQQLDKLPASAETAMAYFEHQAQCSSGRTLSRMRAAIVAEHNAAGLPNPCETQSFKDRFRVLYNKPSPRSKPHVIDSNDLAAIRATALEPRLQASGLERDALAQQRGLIDIALCSVMHATELTPRHASQIHWRDIQAFGEHGMLLALKDKRSGDDSPKVVELTGQVVRDLKAIRGSAAPDTRVFGLCQASAYSRVRAAKQAAGLID